MALIEKNPFLFQLWNKRTKKHIAGDGSFSSQEFFSNHSTSFIPSLSILYHSGKPKAKKIKKI